MVKRTQEELDSTNHNRAKLLSSSVKL